MVNKKLILAPMAGVTDRTFRKLCLEYGADLVVTEMVSAKAISYNDKKSYEIAKLYDDGRPAAIQIFGSDPKAIEYATKELIVYSPVAIDINMGCPVPKIAGNGDGAGLMKTPELAGEVIKAACTALEGTGIPVTVKIRSGWDSKNINAVHIAKIAEENGANAITVHARTRAQGYEGKADRSVIKAVKEAVKIPVIGNGDIIDGESALSMLKETGCDGLMVGRGALGRPWIFAEIKAALNGTAYSEPSYDEKREVMLRQLEMMLSDKGEYVAIHEIRKHIAWYIKGIPDATSIRASVFKTNTAMGLRKIINNLWK